MKKMLAILCIIIGNALAVALSFLLTAGIIAGICWAFSLTFSWKLAVGVYLVLILIRSIAQVTISNSK